MKDEDDTVIGIFPQAFNRRSGEETLSVTWAEYHKSGNLRGDLEAAARTIRASKIDVRPKSAFAFANVADLISVTQSFGKKIRIAHEPTEDNMAHVGIHRWPDEVDELLARLASAEWQRYILNQSIR